jgi:hypothetical protein
LRVGGTAEAVPSPEASRVEGTLHLRAMPMLAHGQECQHHTGRCGLWLVSDSQCWYGFAVRLFKPFWP